MSYLDRVPDVLPFTKADLRLPIAVRKGQRNSISGVQSKVLLSVVDGSFTIVDSGGDFILKPVPEGSLSRFAEDIPANENVTMRIASRLFRMQTAENKCVRFSDGEIAYLTRRFDRRNGMPIRQEDLCQVSGRSEETHGESYKYDFSYEEMADVVRRVCPASRIELVKVFRQIVFDYVFANGDAHLKNFSVYESDFGDYVMTPAYDLLNTMLHYPNDLTFMALSLFKDSDFMTPGFESNGYYGTQDFVVLGKSYGLDEKAVLGIIGEFGSLSSRVEEMVRESLLTAGAQEEYLRIFRDRLAMFR